MIGPFSGRQIVGGLLGLVLVAILLVAVTTPLGSSDGAGPRNPKATPYLIGPAVPGLRPGDIAPDLLGTEPTEERSDPVELALLVAGSVLLGVAVAGGLERVLAAASSLPGRRRRALRTLVPGSSAAVLALLIGTAAGLGRTTVVIGAASPIVDLDGRPVRLADLRGHAVWINFWASWCPPCQAETPVLRDVYEAYRDRGLVLVAISVQESNAADVRSYAERYGLRYTVAPDPTGAVFRRYRVYALPTQFFIGPDGVIRSVVQGPLDEAGARAQIEAILPAPTAAP